MISKTAFARLMETISLPSAAAGAITKLGGRVEATHRYALPGGDARVLIVIRKETPTPSRYPRTAALMKKSPLT